MTDVTFNLISTQKLCVQRLELMLLFYYLHSDELLLSNLDEYNLAFYCYELGFVDHLFERINNFLFDL